MESSDLESQFVLCIENEEYPASLEVRKIYQVVSDIHASVHQLIRIIDESGEDYLYPVNYFTPIDLPEAIKEKFSKGKFSVDS
jgi:hypothetical protein